MLRRVAMAGLVTTVLVGLGTAGVAAWATWTRPRGGPADGAALRPLPVGVHVVAEDGGCGGTGRGWRTCQHTLRLRRDGDDREALRRRVIDHYRTLGFVLEPIGQVRACPADACPTSPVYGEAGCVEQEPSISARCLLVRDAGDWVGPWEHLPPSDQEIDVELVSWAYVF
jgi:hypothetical protein